MSSERNRLRLRAAFDSAASIYAAARPDYPPSLLDRVVEDAGLTPGDALLEVGCGTGIATLPMARRGFAITGVELGPALAVEARRRLKRFRGVMVLQADFDEWAARAGRHQFRLVYAATSWHWLDPATKYENAWRCLEPGGALAFWSAQHVLPDDGDEFFAEMQDVYRDLREPTLGSGEIPRPEDVPSEADEITASGRFHSVRVSRFLWEKTYDADSYLALLDTFSNHIELDPAKRAHLYGEIRRRITPRPDGTVRRHWGAVLHVARRA